MESIEQLQSRATALIDQIDGIERVFRKVIDDPIDDASDREAAFEMLYLAITMRYVAEGALLFPQVPNYPVYMDGIAAAIDRMEQEAAVLIHDLEEIGLWPCEAWDSAYHPLQWRAYTTGQRLIVIALACLGLKDNPGLPSADRQRYAELVGWAKGKRNEVQRVINTHIDNPQLESTAAAFVESLERGTNEVEDTLLMEGYLEATDNGLRPSELVLSVSAEEWTGNGGVR